MPPAERPPVTAERRRTVRRALVIYALIAWVCFVAATAIGDPAFVIVLGVGALVAAVGLVLRWNR